MMLLFTPYTYLFLFFYAMFLLSLFSLSSFYSYWLFMELMTLLLVGLSYTLFTSSISFLMVYFLVQSLSSFLILLAYLTTNGVLFTTAVLLKLGMFPFYSWYLSSVNRFPNFVFWLTGTVHKLPILLMMSMFNLGLITTMMWSAILLTIMLSGLLMLFSHDFRWLLVASSVGNNSWFILSQQCHVFFMLLFVLLYSFFLGCLLVTLNEFSKPMSDHVSDSRSWSFFLLCISGLPPFPLFFLKAYTIYYLYTEEVFDDMSWFLTAFFLVFNALVVAGYIRYLMKVQIHQVGNLSYYLF